KVYRAQAHEALLTAVAVALGRWSGHDRLLIDVEGHGREEVLEGVEVSRTVGWFTTIYPVLLEARLGGAVTPTLKAIKEQLRRVPNRGMGYGLLRYMSGRRDVEERLRELPQAEISFNYLGQFDQVMNEGMRLAPEATGLTQARRETRQYELEIN